MDIKKFRKEALRALSNETGVYALCDLDKKPIYIGQSKDGIKNRVSRHLTSARSDVIANRQLDIWEVCEVWAWPEPDKSIIDALENSLIHYYNDLSPLVNGKIPNATGTAGVPSPIQVVKLMPDDEREFRLNPTRRLPRQLEHLNNLFSHILEVKNNSEQRRMLRVHFNRVNAYYNNFMEESGESEF